MKSKKNQNAFKYGCKHVSRRCESYMMYLKGNGPPSNGYDCLWIFLILLYHYLYMIRHLCFLAKAHRSVRSTRSPPT